MNLQGQSWLLWEYMQAVLLEHAFDRKNLHIFQVHLALPLPNQVESHAGTCTNRLLRKPPYYSVCISIFDMQKIPFLFCSSKSVSFSFSLPTSYKCDSTLNQPQNKYRSGRREKMKIVKREQMAVRKRLQIYCQTITDFLLIQMDYDGLATILPQRVCEWQAAQLSSFLRFLHLDCLLPCFAHMNGMALLCLNEYSLQQLGVNSSIMRRKILRWVQGGLAEFDQFLQRNCKQQLLVDDRKTFAKTEFNIEIQSSQDAILPIRHKKKQQHTMSQHQIASKTQQPRLVIKSHEGVQADFYILRKSPVTIGKRPSSTIRTLEITVEDQHAEIYEEAGRYFLRDLGTRSGTYIKITLRQVLQVGTLIEIGSYLLIVLAVHIPTRTLKLAYFRSSKEETGEINITLSSSNSFTFGRKTNNNFSTNDEHLSGTHAKIYMHRDRFVIEDCNSTNGTWLRLSQSLQRSTPHELTDMMIFKVGFTLTYLCEVEAKCKSVTQWPSECIDCVDGQRNCVLLPCRHNILCSGCASFVTECPACHSGIQEKIQIYLCS